MDPLGPSLPLDMRMVDGPTGSLPPSQHDCVSFSEEGDGKAQRDRGPGGPSGVGVLVCVCGGGAA